MPSSASVGDVGIDVVDRRHGVDDQVEAGRRPSPSPLRRSRARPVRAQTAGVVLLAGRRREQRDMRRPAPWRASGPCGRGRRGRPRATLLPGPTFQWRSGDQVVMPAQSSGAAAFRSSPPEPCSDEFFGDDDLVGIAAVGRHRVAAVVRVVGVGRALVAILLEPATGTACSAGRNRPCSRRPRRRPP